MLEAKDLFGNYKIVRTHNSPRQEMIDYFVEQLNYERVGTKYRKLKYNYVNFKLSHLKMEDLYYLKSICDGEMRRGGSFSKVFFGALKI